MNQVSICIPVYNGGKLIGRALESASAQTHRDLEIVVSDNASGDDTPKIVQSFMARDSRIKYFRNSTNIGLAKNIYNSYEHASGEWVQHLSHDDWLEQNFIEVKLGLIREYPDAAFVISGLDDYRLNSQRQPVFINRNTHRPGVYSSSYIFRNFYRKIGLLGISAMARRKDVLKHFLWNIPNPYGFDAFYEKGISIDNLFLLNILIDYDFLIYTDKTAYNALSHGSNESKQYGFQETLEDRIKFFHMTRLGFEHFYNQYAKAELSRYKVFSGSEMLVTVLFDFFLQRKRRGGAFSALRGFFEGYSLAQKTASIFGIIPEALKRIWRSYSGK